MPPSRPRSPIRVASTLALAALLCLAALPRTADAQAGQITGQVPSQGGFGLVVWGGGMPSDLLAAASARGCELRATWATNAQGQFVGLIFGAPPFVNAAFNAMFPNAHIPAGTPLILVCPSRRGDLSGEVNAIIDLVEARNVDGLVGVSRLTAVACGPQQGIGSPPACPPGQPSGTLVEVVPVASCEGELRPASALRPTYEQVLPTIGRLTGVYRAPRPYLRPIEADYVAVFSRSLPGQPNLGVGVVIANGEVRGLWFGCGASPGQIVPPGTEAVFLPGG